MLCPICSHPCKDGVRFCENCGSRLQSNGTREHMGKLQTPSSSQLHIIRSSFAFPAALLMLIAYSASVVCNLISAVRVPAYIRESLRQLSGFMGAGDGRFEPFTTFYSVVLLLTFLPGALIAVGSWITFASAKNGQGKIRNVHGLQLVIFGLVAEMTLRCVNFGWLGFLFLTSGRGMPGDYYSYLFGYSFSGSVLLRGPIYVTDIMLILFLIAFIIYYRKAVRMAWNMRMTAATGVPSGDVSTYVAVFAIIMGGLVLTDAILLPDLLIVISSSLSAVARISAGIFLLRFRKNMQSLRGETQESLPPNAEE